MIELDTNSREDSRSPSASPGSVVSLVILFLALVRHRGPLIQATVVANFASVVLLAPSCITVGSWLISRAWDAGRAGPAQTEAGRAAVGPGRSISPAQFSELGN